MSIATNLKLLRKDANLTQREFAQKIGLPLRSIINYENGLREPNSKAMAALECFFNVSGAYLRGESEEPVKPVVSSPDLLEIIRVDLPKRMKELAALLESGGDAEAELAYHLVNELVHILKMENSTQRSAAMTIFQDIVVASVFFLDACENSNRDEDSADRIEYAKDVVHPRFEQALEKSRQFLSK